MGFYPRRPVPDSDYLLRRAEAEARMAERAKNGTVANAHHAIADAYLGRLFGDSPGEREASPLTGPSFDSRTAMMLAVKNAFKPEKPAVFGGEFSDVLFKLNQID